MDKLKILPYVDVQHDALAAFDDVEQGIVQREDVWFSAYKSGSPSVHGKVRVEPREGGGVDMTSRDGVQVERLSKTNFEVSVPSLDISALPVRFPRQIVNPPYTKPSPVSPELHINSIAYSSKAGQLVIGGVDGYCVVVNPSDTSSVVDLKGHVGDVLSVQWFPSGEVVLTASSDLSVRVFSSKDGINPRTLRGHTRAITGTAILGVGRQVLSASKDGTVRLWDVGKGAEVKKWTVAERRFVDGLVVVEDDAGLRALGIEVEDHIILAASPDGTITAFTLSSDSQSPPLFTAPPPLPSNLLSVAYSPATGILATGHANGVIALRPLSALRDGSPPTFVKRNEAPIYSLAFVEDQVQGQSVDLLVGTGSGLPCRLALAVEGEGINARVKEEYGGWEATGVETWAVAPDSVWCAGGEGGIRRY